MRKFANFFFNNVKLNKFLSKKSKKKKIIIYPFYPFKTSGIIFSQPNKIFRKISHQNHSEFFVKFGNFDKISLVFNLNQLYHT